MKISTIKNAIDSIKIIKNWSDYFAGYFKLIKKNIVYVLINYTKYKVRSKANLGSYTRRSIMIVWVKNGYMPLRFQINGKERVVDIRAHVGALPVLAT